MPFKWLVGVFALVAVVLSAGLTAGTRAAQAFAVPYAVQTGIIPVNASATDQVSLSGDVARVQITDTVSLFDRDRLDGAMLLTSPTALPPGPASWRHWHRSLEASNQLWDTAWTSFRSVPLEPSIDRTSGDMLTLALLFRQGETLKPDALAHMLIDPSRGDARGVDPTQSCEDGDSCSVAAASVPGAIWLIASALLGLLAIGFPRQRNTPA